MPAALARSAHKGVAIDTLDDVIDLFRGIPLDRVTTSMTINAPAAILLAFYVCAAEQMASRPRRSGARSRPTS